MPVSAESPQPVLATKWALRMGAALLATLALALVLTISDTQRRTVLETASETTGVGDVRYFTPPPKLPAVVELPGGSPMEVLAGKIEVRDTHVRRTAAAAGPGLNIYVLSEVATDEERARVAASGAAFLLKLAPNDYAGAKVAR